MRHHLRKAKDIYAEEGFVRAVESALRYLPVEINNAIFQLRHGSGTRIMDEDWDNLLILDACRYDMFAEQVELNGRLESRVSLGSSSEEFLERNFGDNEFYDTVYINSNPYVPKLGLDEGTFHAVVDCLREWDEDLETVRPETVANAAREANEQFPNKRLIVHFMQPHAPFIGEYGRSMEAGGWTMDRTTDSDPDVWNQAKAGNMDTESLWTAYEENLEVVLDVIGPLLNELQGKSVVTADHGNLVGERLSPIPTRPKYAHPYGIHVPELVKVPWFIVEDTQRPEIAEDPPVNQETVSKAKVEDRLEALGYK
jgi:hypothetical protein